MTTKMATKAQAVALKSAPDDEGSFEAIVAVFNNIDSYGDVILKGAFADTINEWGDSGFPIPVVWSHEKDDPFSHIGVVTESKETDTGLLVKAQLDMDNPKAAQVHRLLKGGRVKEFSFAFSYDMEDVNPSKRDGMEIRELKRLKLYEVGPTLVGANPATQLMGVKSADPKADEDPTGDPAAPDENPTDDPEDTPDDEGSDDWGQARELVSQVSDLLTQLSDIITRNTEPDDSDEDEPGDGDDASRSQTEDDETGNGKSDEVPADRSAEEEQKSLAALYEALL